MPSGTVKWFNGRKGFGFIIPEDRDNVVFVHITAVQEAGLEGLEEGQKVEFEIVDGPNGKPVASDLKTV